MQHTRNVKDFKQPKNVAVLNVFAVLTGENCAGKPAFLLKETPTQVFSCEYCEIFKTSHPCWSFF